MKPPLELLQGIGSRLMKQWGYVLGEGLGRNKEGRPDPVPIQLLPQGKMHKMLSQGKMHKII